MSRGTKTEPSTERRIRKMHTRRTWALLSVMNFVIVAMAIVGWCYANDSAYSGIFQPSALFQNVARQVSILKSSVFYTIRVAGMKPQVIDATGFCFVLVAGFIGLLLVELITVGLSSATEERLIRKQLEPLRQLALSAQQLTDEDFSAPQRMATDNRLESQRIHTLESAIEDFKPEHPDAELHTGDKDLKGLETAINSLIARTRASYSQQIRFVSDASHELRTPIAVIKGYTDLLDRWGKEDEKILSESIEAIKSETENMNRLVEQLLFLARGDSGRQKLNFELFSLCDMVREVHEESRMIDPNHDWQIDAKGEVMVFGDVAMLKQAMRILVDNAAKYTPQGESIMLRAQLDQKGAPCLVVQDNGVGIGKNDVGHVFDRFYRADPSRERHQGGTGLGLSIAKWIVDRHYGYFDILSREGIGTRIIVHFPIPTTNGTKATAIKKS